MDECCGTCHYFCEVKKWPTFEEALTHICVLPLVHDGIDYIIEGNENDMCECYLKRQEQKAF